MTHLDLEIGLGAGNRLLAMGLPDHIFASGNGLVWLAETGIFVWQNQRIEFRQTPAISSISAHEGDWVFSLEREEGISLLCITRDGESSNWLFEGRSVEMGKQLVVLDQGPERRAVNLETGMEWFMPVGARDGHPKPFSDGPGVVWLDGTQVLRFRADSRPQIAGRLPSRPDDWHAGPGGSAVFSMQDGLWGMGPTGGPKRLGPMDYASCRFAPDGSEITSIDGDGWVRVNLTDGHIIERRQGSLIPVGYGPTPVILDEDGGLLKSAEGLLRASGLTPSAAAVYGDVLYGPGGTAWCIQTGKRLWAESPLSGEHLAATGGGVIQVGSRIEGFDVQGNRVFDIPLPIDEEIDGEIFDLHWVDGMMFFEVEDGWVQVDFEGRRVGLNEPPLGHSEEHSGTSDWVIDPETRAATKCEHSVLLPFDGVVEMNDGRGLAWSEDGMLVILDHCSLCRPTSEQL